MEDKRMLHDHRAQRRKPAGSSSTRRSLTCTFCGRSFARSEHLQRHLRTHTKEKPFVCDKCSRSFSRSDLLVRHERLVHFANTPSNRDQNDQANPQATGTQAAGSYSTAPISHPEQPQQARPAGAEPSASQNPTPILNAQPPPPQSTDATRNASFATASSTVNPIQTVPQQSLTPSWGGYDLNLLSHAANHVALEGQQNVPGSFAPQPQESPLTHQQRTPQSAFGMTPSIPGLDINDPVTDFTAFLENVGLSSDWDAGLLSTMETDGFLPSTMLFDPKAPTREDPLLSRIGPGSNAGAEPGQAVTGSVSSYSSGQHLHPSLQPEPNDSEEPIPFDGPGPPRPAWDVSVQDRNAFLSMLEEYSHVLPPDFVPPTRHALSRFVAGYVNGLNGHLPFIHVPTLSVARCSPDLSLAVAAAGCHYRFEHNRGLEFFRAAKAILLERIRRLDEATAVSPPPQQQPLFSTGHAPSISSVQDRHSSHPQLFSNPQPQPSGADPPVQGQGQGSRHVDADTRMDIIRSFLLLTVFASWERHPDLLREMLALQSTLARLVRDHGLSETRPASASENITWEEWAHDESDRRTKLVVYCFFNLHSVMYNIPPLLLSSEIKLNMPSATDEWKANNAVQWRRLYKSRVTADSSFQDALAALFSRQSPESTNSKPVSPLGNYVLIHAVLQQIFFARQLRLSAPSLRGTSLRPEDLTAMDGALSAWKAGWKRGPESSMDPQSPAGPIAFTSTALLGLAYIRLHLDLGPHRALISQDPVLIATTLNASQSVHRSPNLIMALLHSAHALSIPVRLGIDFVARTHSFFWSIQHSICSLEGAFLLSQWIMAVPPSLSRQPLSEHEKKLLAWAKSMMDETDMAADVTNSTDLEFVSDPRMMKQLSVAVVRVWSKTFKGNTSWPIVDLIGSSLEIYADILETQY